MLRWVLAGVGSFGAMIAIRVGVVRREVPDTSGLTELQRAEVLELTDIGSSYRVVYSYTFDDQTSYGRTTIHSDSTFGICVNPEDPIRHAETYTDCSPGEPGTLIEGVTEEPAL